MERVCIHTRASASTWASFCSGGKFTKVCLAHAKCTVKKIWKIVIKAGPYFCPFSDQVKCLQLQFSLN